MRSRFLLRLVPPEQHTARVHSLAHRLHLRGHAVLALTVAQTFRMFTDISIHPGVVLGEGFTVYHGQGVVIGEHIPVRFGANALVFQGVTVGDRHVHAPGDGATVIGDRVTLCAGAKILGPVRIGDDATVGANAVVTDDVPPGTTVVGIPARPIVPAGTARKIQPRA